MEGAIAVSKISYRLNGGGVNLVAQVSRHRYEGKVDVTASHLISKNSQFLLHIIWK